MELAIAIIGLIVASVALGFSGWTSWESRRSAGAALASAKAAESSALASERAVQLEAERLEWERTARLVLVRRTISAYAIEQVGEKSPWDYPSAFGLEFSNAGRAPAVRLKTDALVNGSYIGAVQQPRQSMEPGENATVHFQLESLQGIGETSVSAVVTLTYQDIRDHVLVVELNLYSRSNPPDDTGLIPDRYGSHFLPSVVSVTLDGTLLEGWESRLSER